MRRIQDLPLLVLALGIGCLAMMLPALHGLVQRDLHVARSFFYGSILLLVLVAMFALATAGLRPNGIARSQLVALVGSYLVLPLVFAVPFHEGVRNTTFLNAWFEMVSCFTTTGATLYPDPQRFSPTLHLWRAVVGWLGGFHIWVMAIAVLAPLNLGGFEVSSGPGGAEGANLGALPHDPGARLVRVSLVLMPIYVGLTFALWTLLILAGSNATPALIHAMATLSTSGISGSGGLSGAGTGFGGEFVIAAFLIFALSRNTFAGIAQSRLRQRLFRDHELRLGLLIVAGLPALLFIRHWFGAVEMGEVDDGLVALRALWGAIFTVLSFLTTTGFVSADWAEARSWSGLPTPGLLLMGVAVLGGGVATTAGGVKLLRVWALYTHSTREMERLIHPNSVGGSGQGARRLRREGAEMAWIFFMLFALSVAAVSSAFALAGLSFETSMTLTVAALSTTGPIIGLGAERPVDLIALGGVVKGIFMATMVVGRLETLAFIALLNPAFWRN
jgi:trk system potassium uptake protein